MSLIHRRKSVVFNNPQMTAQKLRISELVELYKNKLKINNRTSSKPKLQYPQKLSLGQALKIQNLHRQTSKSRRSSLNSLLTGFYNNCNENIVQPTNTIDRRKLLQFRSGIYYRSASRSKGAGIKIEQEGLQQYFNCDDSENSQLKSSKFQNTKAYQTQQLSQKKPTNSRICIKYK